VRRFNSRPDPLTVLPASPIGPTTRAQPPPDPDSYILLLSHSASARFSILSGFDYLAAEESKDEEMSEDEEDDSCGEEAVTSQEKGRKAAATQQRRWQAAGATPTKKAAVTPGKAVAIPGKKGATLGKALAAAPGKKGAPQPGGREWQEHQDSDEEDKSEPAVMKAAVVPLPQRMRTRTMRMMPREMVLKQQLWRPLQPQEGKLLQKLFL
ncbi:hypothetical protein P7K49_002122, partial [Saguinus oedipus]